MLMTSATGVSLPRRKSTGRGLAEPARTRQHAAMANTPINLNKHRKARAKAARRAQADRNAVLHGLPKAERERAQAEEQRRQEQLGGHALDDGANDET